MNIFPYICRETWHPLPFALYSNKWQPAANQPLFWHDRGDPIVQLEAQKKKSLGESDRLRIHPTNSSCWKIDRPRRYCPAPTHNRQYCLGKDNNGLKWRLMGTECTLTTVGYRLRQALLVSNVFPFAKHHLPRGLRVSIGQCRRPFSVLGGAA